MIIDAILIMLQGIVNILLAPLTVLNWVTTTTINISVIQDFINIIVFVLPWQNIMPIIIFIIGMFLFRAIVALIKTIWDLLPIL